MNNQQVNLPQQTSSDDLLAPLTQHEQSQVRIALLTRRIETLNKMQEEYLTFLEETKKLVKDLSTDEQTVKDELAKLETRQKLMGNP